jgi:aspartyl-tRNA(Asn)/glutamyl-tRNA(Gln) amidotransferase subunit B
LVSMETAGELTASQAKDVLAEMVASGDDPAAIAKAKGYEAMDTDVLVAAVDQVIAANPKQWARFVEGEGKVMGFFVGEVMKATNRQADGKAVTALLRQRAEAGA